jgi:ActR/RegA family two-component response regulator
MQIFATRRDMRVLLADHDATLLEAMARTARDLVVLDIVRTKIHGLDLLRSNAFDAAIVCDELADGTGLDLIAQIAHRFPTVPRVFVAEPRRLWLLEGRLGAYNLFQTLRYPIAPGELRALLQSVQAAQAANVDATLVQHIVLESESHHVLETNSAAALQSRFQGVTPADSLSLVEGEGEQRGSEMEWPGMRPSAPLPAAPAHAASTPQLSLDDSSLKLELAPDWRPGDAVQPQFPGKSFQPQSQPQRGTANVTPIGRARAQLPAGAPPVVLPVNGGTRKVIVVTRDKEVLDTAVAALAGRAVSITHTPDEDGLAKLMKLHGAIAVLIDLGAGGGATARLLERVSSIAGETRVLAVGRAADTSHVAPLLSKGAINRFLVKPLNRVHTRAAFDSVIGVPVVENSPEKTDVPFSSLIDRVSAAELGESMARKRGSLLRRIALAKVRKIHLLAASGVALAVLAMLGLAFVISS